MSTQSKQCREYRTAFVAAVVMMLAGCSDGTPRDVPEFSASERAISPFAKLADPGGCIIEQITTADYDEYQTLSVSADGKLLAVTSRIEGAEANDTVYQVHEVELATGNKAALSQELTNAGPFSPDGRFIVLAQETDNGKTDIVEYERATGELHAVAPHEDWDWLPNYSPDGRYIVFNSYRVDGQSDIHLFEKATGVLTRLTEFPGYDAHGQFSPDGKRILFHRQQGTRDDGGYLFDLIVHNLETGAETQLTNGDHEQGYPSWAPDGRHIVFSSDLDGQPAKPNLYVLAPSGETSSRLTRGIWKDSYAVWSRDGRFIYFNSDRTGVTNVYRMPMSGVDCIRDDAGA